MIQEISIQSENLQSGVRHKEEIKVQYCEFVFM